MTCGIKFAALQKGARLDLRETGRADRKLAGGWMRPRPTLGSQSLRFGQSPVKISRRRQGVGVLTPARMPVVVNAEHWLCPIPGSGRQEHRSGFLTLHGPFRGGKGVLA
jgi:hypothetical protein